MTMFKDMKDITMKRLTGTLARPLVLAAGVSVALAGFGGFASAQTAEGAVTEEALDVPAPAAPATPPKPVKRKVTVISSDGGQVEERDGKIIIRSDHNPIKFRSIHMEAREKALTEVQFALDEINERLKKAKNKDERKALETAVKALETSIGALKSPASIADIAPLGNFKFEFDDDVVGALSELRLHEGDLEGMRFELQGDLAEARAEIAEALAGLEIEVDRDGDLRRLRIRSLQDAARDLDGLEERHLEELKRAQEDIARARADLEKRIEERKTRKAAEKDGDGK